MTRVFIGRATDLDIHREMLQTQGDDRRRKMEVETGVIRLQAPKISMAARNHRKLEEARKETPLGPSGERGPADNSMQTSSLPGCERGRGCHFKPPS